MEGAQGIELQVPVPLFVQVQLPLPPQLTEAEPDDSVVAVQPPPAQVRVRPPAPLFLAVQPPWAQSSVQPPGPKHSNAHAFPSHLRSHPAGPLQVQLPLPLHVLDAPPLEELELDAPPLDELDAPPLDELEPPLDPVGALQFDCTSLSSRPF